MPKCLKRLCVDVSSMLLICAHSAAGRGHFGQLIIINSSELIDLQYRHGQKPSSCGRLVAALTDCYKFAPIDPEQLRTLLKRTATRAPTCREPPLKLLQQY